MSSPTSPTKQRTGIRFALLPAALSAVLGCSSERLVATAIVDAGQDAAPCVPDTRMVSDMGIDVYFLLDRSEQLNTEWIAIGSWFTGLPVQGEFAGIGIGFATTPAFAAADGPCAESCGNSCGCLARNCGCNVAGDRQGGCYCVTGKLACTPDAYATPTLEISRPRETQDQIQLALVTLLKAPVFGEAAFRLALQGSQQYRASWERDHGNRHITQIVISSTLYGNFDTPCEDRPPDIEKVVASASTTKTYVIGIDVSPGDVDDFHRIARAGQTAMAKLVTFAPGWPGSSSSPENPLPEVLRKIRATEGRCEYLLPTTALGFDADEVNLAIDGQNPSSFVRVKDRSACSANALGWYYEYDAEQRPTRILTCENTCTAIHQAQSTGSAQLQTGCPSVTAGDAGRP